MSKELFKSFAKTHPELADTVLRGNATWQQLYEIFEIYGENSSIWNSYIKSSSQDVITSSAQTFKDFFNTIKNLDIDSVQKGVNNLQKTIGLLQDIGLGSKKESGIYEPRPLYKRFDD